MREQIESSGTCGWFARCTREAVVLVAHPAFDDGVPVCEPCLSRLTRESDSVDVIAVADGYELTV